MTGEREGAVLVGTNPFDVDPELDLPHPVPDDVPGWSETMFFHVWSPESGVGVFVHTGRWPSDPELWWAQTIALLPEGGLLVDRSWGRSRDRRGPSTGNLRVSCTEPLHRWTLAFDGAGEVTDLRRMAAGPSGAGRARPFAFDLDLEAAAGVWDMHRALGIDGLAWAAAHHTQGLRARGRLTAGERTWRIDGVAHRDHSSGPRDVARVGGLHFCLLVFPRSGRVLNGLVNWTRDDRVDHRTFALQEGGRCEIGSAITVTGLADYRTHEPRTLTVKVRRADGSRDVLEAEWLHGYSLTFLEPNENLNGVDLGPQPDALVVTQSTVRATAPDGEIGYGVIERDYRPSALPSPQER